jgi:bifunctional non-homologous end joining protein LigD
MVEVAAPAVAHSPPCELRYNPVMPAAFPDWVEPMAATLTRERFTGADWIFERKFDGVRLLAFKRGSHVLLLSRNKLPQNEAYPQIVAAVARLPQRELILDGEATGVWGRQGTVAYHVFDVMWIDARDVMGLPLAERREQLDGLPLSPPLYLVPRLEHAAPWELAREQGWEGVIAKRHGSVYEQRRSLHWLKMKCEASQALVVGGFTDPRGGRVGLGALLVGYFEGDAFVFAGKVGTGFDNALLVQLRQRLDPLEQPTSPFTRAVNLPRLGVHWVRPELVVQVAFMEWTAHRKLRHPRLLGVRLDKGAREVSRETATD